MRIDREMNETAAGGLDESLAMLQPRLPENHPSAASRISAFQLFRISAFTPQRPIAELRSFVDFVGVLQADRMLVSRDWYHFDGLLAGMERVEHEQLAI
jgi:hypothetical protein